MNSLCQFSRWKGSRQMAKQTTPEPIPAKQSSYFNPKSARRNDANSHGATPQGRRHKDALTVTIKHQNRSPSHQESSSLSTKYNIPHNRFRNQATHSKDKAQNKQNSLSLQRFLSGGKRVQGRHKINYSILQRIRRALSLYPNIAQEFKLKSPKVITFATQSEDQAKQSSENDAINLQKLVLWRQSKLIKTTERIYEYLMQVEIRQGESSSKKMQSPEKISIKTQLKHYLMHRYKTEKLCRQNFINLLYSLYYYTDKAEYECSLKSSSPYLRMKLRMFFIFEKFLSLDYNQDDLIFYLYSRNIFTQVLGKESRSDEMSFVTAEQVRRFLSVLANGDACIVRYYEQYLVRAIGREGHSLEVHEILYLLLTNFQEKKSRAILRPEIQRAAQREKDWNSRSQGLSCSRIGIAYDRCFWQTEPPSQQTIPDTLYEKLLEQIGRQTKKLMSYFHSESSPTRDATAQLVLIKSIRMLNTVHKMDKYRWFQEMQLVRQKVLVAKGRDFQEIEALQKELRGIEESERQGKLQKRRVADFAKKLLTVNAFVDKMEELFQAVENESIDGL